VEQSTLAPEDGAPAPVSDGLPKSPNAQSSTISVEELANQTSDVLVTTLAPPVSAGIDFESNASLPLEQQNATLPLTEDTQTNLTNPENPAPLPANPEIVPEFQLTPAANETKTPEQPKNETEILPEFPLENNNQTLTPVNETATIELDNNNGVVDTAKFLLPSKIDPLRLTVIGFTGKPVHTFNLSADQILYQMKVFWGEPESWQDIGYQPTERLFEVFCWLNTNGGFGRDLFKGNLSASLISHSQWYAFPETEDNSTTNISVNCGIRPFNGAGKFGDWTFADAAPVRDAPVFLRGFENVNVRGWTKDEVVRLIKNQKRLDSPQTYQKQAAAAAKQKSKSRRS